MGADPPTTLKQYDSAGIVLHCGSFTKSLTAGVRLGWALAGRYREQVERLKFIDTHSTSAIAQRGVADSLTLARMASHASQSAGSIALRNFDAPR